MNNKTIEKILNFLKEKEGKEIPQDWNLIEKLETHPDDTQYRYQGNLRLSGANITKLPNDLYVDGNLYLNRNKQLTKLPNDLYVEWDLDLRDCSQLTKLPDDLHVGGYLALNDSNITELPNELYVGSDLYIGSTPLVQKYSSDEIKEIVSSTGGQIIGKIYTK